MDTNSRNKTKIVASFFVMLAVVLVTVIADTYKHISLTDGIVPQAAVAGPTGTASGTNNSTASYKDGTYTAQSDYYVPSGYETIRVTLTLKDGTVTDSRISNSESNPESAFYQQQFAQTYKTYVIGKKLSGVDVSYVAGASHTSRGFNDALSRIMTQAQA